jgi:rhodanese-related sulfurtransferase
MKMNLVSTRLLLVATTAAAMSVMMGCSTTGSAPAAKAADAAKPAEVAVKITPALASVDVMHAGKPVTIMRNQDTNSKVNAEFAKTSRKCPPFCIQPFTLAPGVETIGEVEILDYLKKMNAGDSSILAIDSRTPDWVARGTIPGSINIPFTKLKDDADPLEVADVLTKQLGAVESGQGYDYSKAKTLVMFCNGAWCGQSPTNIAKLLKMGYPASKIKWYRGGMQSWSNLGFNTVTP